MYLPVTSTRLIFICLPLYFPLFPIVFFIFLGSLSTPIDLIRIEMYEILERVGRHLNKNENKRDFMKVTAKTIVASGVVNGSVQVRKR